MSEKTITPLPWKVTKWTGADWPERRWSITDSNGFAVAITPRYANEQTEIDFEHLVSIANAYPALTARVKELEEIRDYYMQSAEKASKGRHWAEIRVKELEEENTRLRKGIEAKARRFERKAKKYRKWVDSTERAFADTYEECAAELRALLGEGK